jgi:hypothetical protein
MNQPISCTVLIVNIYQFLSNKQITNKMSKEVNERIIPHEVIIVGKLRDDKDVTPIDLTLPVDEQILAALKKFKFVRDTAPNAAAQAVGFLSGKFFQIQMGDPGGETVTLPNGQKVRRSRKTSAPGYATIFASNRATTFEEIKEEALYRDPTSKFANKLQLVGGDPNNGKLKLKEYALFGFWDKFPLGFFYEIHTRDEKGAIKKMMSNVKQDDGSFKPVPATTNTGEHFVFEDEVDNLEGIRDKMRAQVERWKITVSDTTAEDKSTKPAEEKKPDAPAVNDDL